MEIEKGWKNLLFYWSFFLVTPMSINRRQTQLLLQQSFVMFVGQL